LVVPQKNLDLFIFLIPDSDLAFLIKQPLLILHSGIMKNNIYTVLVILMISTTSAFAQPGFDDSVDDVAPIPGIVIAIIAAIGIGIVKLRKKD
jgi:hypothetical protein